VLITYFSGSALMLNTARANSLALIPDGQPKSDGIAVGDAAANAMIALRANDGSSPAQFKIPGPVVFRRMAGHAELSKNEWNRGRSLLSMGERNPIRYPSVSEFLLDPPPALESNQYAKAYNEVKAVGSIDSKERSQDRADVVHFYAASSPTFIFNLAARQVVAQEGGVRCPRTHGLLP